MHTTPDFIPKRCRIRSGTLEQRGCPASIVEGESCPFVLDAILAQEGANREIPQLFSLIGSAKKAAETCTPGVSISSLEQELSRLGMHYKFKSESPYTISSIAAIPVLKFDFGMQILKKHVIMVSGQHPREWASQGTLVQLSMALLVHCQNNDTAYTGTRFTILPTINPVGCLLSRGFRDGDSDSDSEAGGRDRRHINNIDMNRNWPVCWTRTEYASGEFPASLLEVDALTNYFSYITGETDADTLFIDFHSYGRLFCAYPSVNLRLIQERLFIAFQQKSELDAEEDITTARYSNTGPLDWNTLDRSFRQYLDALSTNPKDDPKDEFWSQAAALVLYHNSDIGSDARQFTERSTSGPLSNYSNSTVPYWSYGTLTDYMALKGAVSILIETSPESAEFSTDGQFMNINATALRVMEIMQTIKFRSHVKVW